MKDVVRIAIVGLGSRGRRSYAEAIRHMEGRAIVTAVADPDQERLAEAQEALSLPPEKCFAGAEEFFSQPKLADAVLICTQDQQHVPHGLMALAKGYDILMEKPISPDETECRTLLARSEETGRKVVICHVLRYTPFYRKLKEILDSGILGELMSIQASEDVGYWHQAHSFVRGKWRSSDTTSPMILAKCCHDMDLWVWLTGRRCVRVSSFGSLGHFTPEHAPEGAAMRCLDGCKAKETCPYDAEKIYITNKRTGVRYKEGWPCNVLTMNPTEESVYHALKEGPYGRCVYFCDNNVVDHQVVNLEMEGGLTVNFSMCAFNELGRCAKFMGTHGYLTCDLERSVITVMPFGKEPVVYDLNPDKVKISGHSGGDEGLMGEFIDYMQGEEPEGITSLAASMESHFICFAAEESRINNGKPVEMAKYRS